MAGVGDMEFLQGVKSAAEHASEEQRVQPILWDTVKANVQGPKRSKAVFNAAEAARLESIKDLGFATEISGWVRGFIEGTVERVAKTGNGSPLHLFAEDEA